MRHLKSFLLSASSLAALSASAIASDLPNKTVVQPKADSLLNSGTSISIEGAFLSGDISGVDKTGAGSAGIGLGGVVEPLGDMRGYNAAIAINRRIDPQWDVSGSLALTRFMDQSSSQFFSAGFGSGGSGSGLIELNGSHGFETFDLDVGYHAISDKSTDIRIFAGLRGLHASKGSSKLGIDNSGGPFDSFGSSVETEFLGVGPRIGIDARTRFEGTGFGLFGSVSGAMIFGHENQSLSITSGGTSFTVPDEITSGITSGALGNQSKTVTNLDAALGIDLTLGAGTVISAGYKAQQYWNVGVDYNDTGIIGIGDNGHDLSHGPFVKLTTQF